METVNVSSSTFRSISCIKYHPSYIDFALFLLSCFFVSTTSLERPGSDILVTVSVSRMCQRHISKWCWSGPLQHNRNALKKSAMNILVVSEIPIGLHHGFLSEIDQIQYSASFRRGQNWFNTKNDRKLHSRSGKLRFIRYQKLVNFCTCNWVLTIILFEDLATSTL